MRTRTRLRILLASGMAVAVAGALSGACSRGPSDPVQALLAEMEAAAEARDADRLGELLAADFRLPDGLGKTVAVAEAKRYFTVYETVGLNVYDVSVERGQGSARVQCVIEITGQAKKLPGFEGFVPPEEAYRFDFELIQEGSRWRFRSVRWERAQPAGGGT